MERHHDARSGHVSHDEAFEVVRRDGAIDYDFYRARACKLRLQARSDLLRKGLRLPMAGVGLLVLLATLALLPATA